MVELAIVMPFLALLFLTIVDLGLVIREHQVVQNAAREGARYSILPKSWIDPRNPLATQSQITTRVTDYLTQEGIPIGNVSITVDQGHPIGVGGGLTVTATQVTVTYTRSLLIPGIQLWGLPTTLTLSGNAIFRNLY